MITLAVISVIAGTIGSIAGFGIGSLLTPLIALKQGISVAVVGVAVAHFIGTAVRLFFLRKSINKQVLLTFGLTSAAGGIIGAFLHNMFQNTVLTIMFGSLLLITGISGLTGLSEKVRFRGAIVWLLGGISGIFGGLVGNQGSIRSGALLGFNLEKNQFVSTATGIALMVDIARLPVYLAGQWSVVTSIWESILIMAIGVVIGTFAGWRLLEKIPDNIFKKAVSAVIFLIGILILVRH